MFALLEHTAREGIHWDFVIEVPGQALLPTWRLLRDPLTCPGDIPAEPIADHRPHFLQYEGKLSGDLGSVRRIDRGEAVVERFDSGELVARLAGDHLCGRCEIVIAADGQRQFRLTRDPGQHADSR